jgi:GNAT superfamily N-acetyltransferase
VTQIRTARLELTAATLLQAEIAGLVVDETARGGGIGRRLLEAAEQWARSHGCRAIRVRSNVVREGAHAFYVREGFREIKTQKVFEKGL